MSLWDKIITQNAIDSILIRDLSDISYKASKGRREQGRKLKDGIVDVGKLPFLETPPPTAITKTIPVDGISIKYWGRGEIATEGKGLVVNPVVRYGFTYDTCSNIPVIDPKCPGYKPNLPQTTVSDLTEDDYVKQVLGTKYVVGDIEEEERLRELLKPGVTPPKKPTVVNKNIQNVLLTAEAAANAAAFESLNNIQNIDQYTTKELFGGVYPDALKFPEKALKDNPRGRRLNMSQQVLHNSLTDMQYKFREVDK